MAVKSKHPPKSAPVKQSRPIFRRSFSVVAAAVPDVTILFPQPNDPVGCSVNLGGDATGPVRITVIDIYRGGAQTAVMFASVNATPDASGNWIQKVDLGGLGIKAGDRVRIEVCVMDGSVPVVCETVTVTATKDCP